MISAPIVSDKEEDDLQPYVLWHSRITFGHYRQSKHQPISIQFSISGTFMISINSTYGYDIEDAHVVAVKG